MDPCQEVTESGMSSPSRSVPAPHQINLILTVSDNPGNSHFPVLSGLTGCVVEKGPLIAGF